MSTRTVQKVDRVIYAFSRDELLALLLAKGQDNRGQSLLNKPTKVDWTKDGIVLTYDYAKDVPEEEARSNSDVVPKVTPAPDAGKVT